MDTVINLVDVERKKIEDAINSTVDRLRFRYGIKEINLKFTNELCVETVDMGYMVCNVESYKWKVEIEHSEPNLPTSYVVR